MIRKELCVLQVSIRKYLNVMWGLSFIFLRKLTSKVSDFHLVLCFFLPGSSEPQKLTLVLQIKLFVLTLLPAHTDLLVSLRTSSY